MVAASNVTLARQTGLTERDMCNQSIANKLLPNNAMRGQFESRRASFRQRGLTLIELLVSMVIAMIVLAGVVQMMVDNKVKFKLADELAFIQENARFALDELGRDLRMVGYSGCGTTTAVANVVDSTDDFYAGFGLVGWDGSENANEFPVEFRADLWGSGNANAPDAFLIRRLDADEAEIIDDSAPNTNNSAVIKIVGSHDIEKGAILVAINQNCTQVSIFQHTGIGNDQYIHNTGASTSPGNCTKSLFGSGDCNNTGGLSTKDFGNGGMVAAFSANAYYIAPSSIDASIPSLYREKVQATAGASATVAEELIIGVENMQVTYGVDTNATADGQVNRYLDADQITGVGTLNWGRVGTARVELLLRSLDPVWAENTTFVFNGANYTDRLLRQTVSTTVLLRNMALVE